MNATSLEPGMKMFHCDEDQYSQYNEMLHSMYLESTGIEVKRAVELRQRSQES